MLKPGKWALEKFVFTQVFKFSASRFTKSLTTPKTAMSQIMFLVLNFILIAVLLNFQQKWQLLFSTKLYKLKVRINVLEISRR